MPHSLTAPSPPTSPWVPCLSSLAPQTRRPSYSQVEQEEEEGEGLIALKFVRLPPRVRGGELVVVSQNDAVTGREAWTAKVINEREGLVTVSAQVPPLSSPPPPRPPPPPPHPPF